MKILLAGINAKFIHSNPALYYLKSYVLSKTAETLTQDRSCGQSEGARVQGQTNGVIEIAEYTINQEKSEIVRDIYERKPDVIAFSVYLWNVKMVYAVIKDISKVLIDTHIWLGGPEVSFDPYRQLEKYPMVRGIIAGEGEENFYRLVCAYLGGNSETLPKVIAADGMLDLDDVPFPYDDLSLFDNRIVYYETSRGCPFGCTYCLSSVDTKVRLRSLGLVYSELQRFLDAGIPLVKFVDRTFNCNPAHTLSILCYILEHDNGTTCFHFEMAAELITDDELAVLEKMRPGLVQIEVGIQTTNCDTLKAIRRHADFENLSRIVKKIISFRNMHVHVDLIAGLPYEGLDSFIRSFNDVYALHADELQLGFLKVLKGSPMEQQAEEFGIVYEDDPPYEVLSTKWLSFDELLELKKVEDMLEVYYNSRQFVNSMDHLEEIQIAASPYQMYLKLAEFYEKKGYTGRSLSRYDRYRILREYVIEETGGDGQKAACFTERLMHDLYLRDKVKSRPDYGTAGVVDKTEYKNFFVSGRYLEYLTGYEKYSTTQIANMVHIEKNSSGYCLYDYLHKDPLSGNAKVFWMESL